MRRLTRSEERPASRKQQLSCVTAEHVEFLKRSDEAGVFILDPADPAQRKLRVVRI